MKKQQVISNIIIKYKDDETAKQKFIDFIIDFLLNIEEKEEE